MIAKIRARWDAMDNKDVFDWDGHEWATFVLVTVLTLMTFVAMMLLWIWVLVFLWSWKASVGVCFLVGSIVGALWQIAKYAAGGSVD